MERYFYLNLLPEALVASTLPPFEFGTYCAKNMKKRIRGEAFFIEVDPEFESEYLSKKDDPDLLRKKTPDGRSSRFVYTAIYRALEHIPVSNLKNMYLATDNGHVLELIKSSYIEEKKPVLHFYQEIIPLVSRIASSLNPLEFCRFVTNPGHAISVPRLAFTELILNDLAADPAHASVKNLPYHNMEYLRQCLIILQNDPGRKLKNVMRCMHSHILYRTIKNGFFIGDQKEFCWYPFPGIEELEEKHYLWWRRAQKVNMDF